MKKIIILLLFEILLFTQGQAQPLASADFLLIENPGALFMFNEFQQSLTAAQTAALGHFVPLQIISSKSFLGDDITPVLKGKISGSYYYVLQNNQGRLLYRANSGWMKRYRRCTVFNDTIRITKSGVNFFFPRSPGLSIRYRLQKDQMLQLVFKNGSYIYARLLGAENIYGWLPASSERYWKKRRVAQFLSRPTLDAHLRRRLTNRFASANHKYQLLFAYFKGRNSTDLPHWEKTEGGHRLVFRLQPPHFAQLLKRSTQILLADIQGDLIGSSWQARYENGQIVIENK